MKLAIASFLFVTAPLFADPDIDKVLQVVSLNPNGQPGQFVLKNLSGQVITAYEYEATIQYPGGQGRSGPVGVDELQLLVNDAMATRIGAALSQAPRDASNQSEIFRPGLVKTISSGKNTLVGVEVKMVTLADGTVLGMNQFATVHRHRQQDLETMRRLLAELKDVQAATSPSQRAQELLTTREKSGKSNDGPSLYFQMIARASDGKTLADKLVEMYEVTVDELQNHFKRLDAKFAPAK